MRKLLTLLAIMCITPAMADDFPELSTDEILEPIMKKREAYSKTFRNAIDTNSLEAYAGATRQEYLGIVASDPELTYQARNFSSLTHEQKQAFGQKVIDKYNGRHGCQGASCKMGQDVDFEHLERSQMGAQFDGEITISAQSKTRLENMGYAGYENSNRTSQTLDEFMDTLAHENNHWHDESGQGFLNSEQARIGKATAGSFTNDDEIYNMNLTEHASHVIGNTVGDGFLDALENILRSRH
ncbi:hypothetical protein HDR66_02185 [bacterium]|nr:hypothetical protein [bacterium]